MTLLTVLAFAAPQAQQGNPFAMLLPMILIFLVIYFLMLRPQKKKEEKRQAMITAVKKGDKVVTIGGIHGSVTQVDETSLLLQVDANVKLRVEKSAISNVAGKE